MRIRFVLTLFVAVWLALLVRVYYLAVKSNEYYSGLSDSNSIKTELIAPVRGTIFDRNGLPIAINRLGFKIMLVPHLTINESEELLHEELRVLSSMLPTLQYEKMLEQYQRKDSYYNHQPIVVADFVDYEEMLPHFTSLNLRERIKIVPASQRYYPYGQIAAHLIGYVSRASRKEVELDPLLKLIGYVGKSGIEKSYNEFLQGVPGERMVKVSAHNEEIEEISQKLPDENHRLTLNLDMRLQKYLAELFEGKVGAAVVMSVTGEMIAAGSYPEYDLNTFASGISIQEWKALIENIDAPFSNKIINGLYPPGSVIKTGLGLIYITTALTSDSRFYCTGSMELGKRNFRCWKQIGHDGVEINKAIRESCDDYFYKGSLKVGIETMSAGLERFGSGQKSGIDIPNEFIGTVPNPQWKRQRYNQPWYNGETLNTSIGQGSFLATPMQIARYTALMATGVLPTPKVARALGEQRVESEFKEVLEPRELLELPRIRHAMEEVCDHPQGTASRHIRSKVRIAGKTGTAQVVGISQEVKKRAKEHEMGYYQRSHAWLSTYAPAERPQYVVTILIEHGGHGGEAAGPIVSKLYDRLLELGYIESTEPVIQESSYSIANQTPHDTTVPPRYVR